MATSLMAKYNTKIPDLDPENDSNHLRFPWSSADLTSEVVSGAGSMHSAPFNQSPLETLPAFVHLTPSSWCVWEIVPTNFCCMLILVML